MQTDFRIPRNATSAYDLWQYFDTRARQILHEDFRWNGRVEWAPEYEGKAIRTIFEGTMGRFWAAFFVLPHVRSTVRIEDLASASPHPILTVGDPGAANALRRLGVRYKDAGSQFLPSVEYRLVEELLGNQRHDRSLVFRMNLVDEGLAFLRWTGAAPEVCRAFFLTPLLVPDGGLTANLARIVYELRAVPDGAHIIALAMEFRSIINGYRVQDAHPTEGIRLSPATEVNHMLAATFVQRRKDYEMHLADGRQAGRMSTFLTEWCERLGYAGAPYERIVARLPGKPAPQFDILPAR